jgi:hypothetical protein
LSELVSYSSFLLRCRTLEESRDAVGLSQRQTDDEGDLLQILIDPGNCAGACPFVMYTCPFFTHPDEGAYRLPCAQRTDKAADGKGLQGGVLLADPVAILVGFMVGASAGSALSYLYSRTALRRYRNSIESACAEFNRKERTDLNCQLKALLLCRDPETVGIVSHLFREVGVETQTCDSESHVLPRLASGKYEALVLDCDELAACPDVVKNVRAVPPNQGLPVFVIASEENAKGPVSSLDNAFLIGRPLVLSDIRSLLRTVYGRMIRSSQAYFRMNVEIPVSLARAAGPVLQCSTLNISQNGMAVITPVSLDLSEGLKLMFVIPHTDVVVSAEGTVIWDNAKGKAGIRFECSSATAQARFLEWLHDHFCIRFDAQSVNAQIHAGHKPICAELS